MTEFFSTYMQLIATKYNLFGMQRNNPDIYIQGLIDEAQEIQEEYRADNHVHLEDELGDVLWDYMNLLYTLQQEGKIRSREHVFHRSAKKFGQRVQGEQQGIDRDITKAKQKLENKMEHEEFYPTA